MLPWHERIQLPRWATLTAKLLSDFATWNILPHISLETMREDRDRACVRTDDGHGYYVIPSIFT